MTAPTQLIRWASGEASGTIISGLNISTIEWHSFDLVDVVFSDSPDLSAVAAGHFLVITGSPNAVNNGRFPIVEKDAAAYRLRVRMTAAISHTSSYDESSSIAVADVENGGPQLAGLPDSKIENGFFWNEYPSADQLNTLLKNVTDWIYHFRSKWGRALVGLSYISSSAWSAIDGAGDPRASAVDTSASSWTGDDTDNAYRDLTGSDQTLTTGANRVLWLMTGQQNDYTSINPYLKILYGASTLVEIADSSGSANNAGSFSLFGLTPALSAGSNTIKAQMGRHTDRTISEIRAAAIELPATDANGNTIQYAHITSGTAQLITDSTSYTTLTDYTQTLTYGTASKVLVLGSVSCLGVAANPVVSLRVRNTTDNVTLGHEMDFTSSNLVVKQNEQGFIRFARLYDLGAGGSKTIVTQMRSQGNNLRVLNEGISAAVGGQFCLIELPESLGTKTPVLYSTDIASDTTTSATAEELHTSPSQTFNGAPCLFYLSGVIGTSANAQVGYVQFTVDGVAVGEEQEVRVATGSTGERPVLLTFPHTPAAGSHTVGAVWRTSTGTFTLTDAQFGCVEFLTNDPQAGDSAEVELTDNTGNPVELKYSGVYKSSSGAATALRFTRDGTPLEPVFEFTPDTTEHPFTITVTDDEPAAAGADPVYAVEAKTASGTLTLKKGDFSAKEFAA